MAVVAVVAVAAATAVVENVMVMGDGGATFAHIVFTGSVLPANLKMMRVYFHLDINVHTKNTKLMCFCGCHLKPNCSLVFSLWKCYFPQRHIYITKKT